MENDDLANLDEQLERTPPRTNKDTIPRPRADPPNTPHFVQDRISIRNYEPPRELIDGALGLPQTRSQGGETGRVGF